MHFVDTRPRAPIISGAAFLLHAFSKGKTALASQGNALNINQVKYFISVVECGSFSSAASEQFITAQGMSKAIADLEAEVGAQLLTRKNRGVSPTDFGFEFYERAKLVMSCYEDLESFARGYKHRAEGSQVFNVYICIPAFGSKEKVSVNVTKFVRANLGVEAEVSFGSKSECLAALDSGDADAVIAIGEAEVPGYECLPVGKLPCGVQITKRSPLSQQPYIRLADLADTRVALWPNYDFFNDTIQRLLIEKNAPFTPHPADRSIRSLIKLYAVGSAVLLPRIAALDVDILQTTPVSFHPDEGLYVPLYIIGPARKSSPAFAAFCNLAAAHNNHASATSTAQTIAQVIPSDEEGE